MGMIQIIHTYNCSILHPIIACEHLIRRMLQLDPVKRLPLAKVLEHKWMQEGEEGPKILPHKLINRTASGNILWNDKVLQAIQRLNFNVETVKQVGCVHTYIYFNITTSKTCFMYMYKIH